MRAFLRMEGGRIGGCRRRKLRCQVPKFQLKPFNFGVWIIDLAQALWSGINITRGLQGLQHRRQHRQVVRKSLSAGCAGGEDDIFARAGLSPCGELVGIERVNVTGG
jgi:hypothetical protein